MNRVSQGITVELYQTDDTWVDVATTDSNGYFQLIAPAGSYYLKVEPTSLPTGYQFTASGQGGDPQLDSDVDISTERPTHLA